MTALQMSSRRPLAIYLLLASALLVGSIVFFTQFDTPAIIPARFCASDAQGSFSGGQSHSGGHHDAHPIDRFVQEFPKLRKSEEQGVPDTRNDGRVDFDWPSIRTMFAFGDSFTTNYRNIREQGIGDGRPDTLWHLDHRLTDRTWTDWLWGMFKDTRTTKYYNLARAGATISRDVLKPGKEEWGTFEDQIEDFKDFFTPLPGPASVDWDPKSSVFLLFFGINDISQLDRMDEGVMPIEETCAAFAQKLFALTDRLYTLSARNFVFLNAHPFYRSPKYTLPHAIGHDIHSRVVDSVTFFNRHFSTDIDSFRQEHRDANVLDFDLFRFYNLILDYPELFGITDTERFLMRWEGMEEEEETEYGQMGFAFRDFQHPSWSVQNLIARTLNGYLLRHSSSFTRSNATEDGLYVQHRLRP